MSSRRVLGLTKRRLTACALALLWLAGASGAETHAGERSSRFDIPAQPLAEALRTFGTASGLDILVDGRLIEGRVSVAIHGDFAPVEALRRIVAGSDLAVRPVGAGSFTLAALPTAPDPRATGEADHFVRYSSRIQAAVTRALCREVETRPGSYRAAVQLWIEPDGRVSRSALLGSTGSAERDAAIADRLRTVRLDERPPRHLPQPATLLIVPRVDRSCQPTDFASVRP